MLNSKAIISYLALFLIIPMLCGFSILSEVESGSTYRGDISSLNFPKTKVYIENNNTTPNDISKELQTILDPIATIITSPGQEDVRLSYDRSTKTLKVKLLSSQLTTTEYSYTLPSESKNLEKTLNGYALYLSMLVLENNSNFKDFNLKVSVLEPTNETGNDTIDIQGSKWKKNYTIQAGNNSSLIYKENNILSFTLVNNTNENLYAYIINYTNDGMVIPVFAPDKSKKNEALIPYGQEKELSSIYLGLSAKSENIRLIVSRYPLDLSSLSQDSITENSLQIFQSDEVVKNSDWKTINYEFKLVR